MKKYVRSLHHPDSKRAHIPSGEEAGYEADSPRVREKADVRRFPRNPVVQRGQDPELFWMNKYGPNDDAQPTTVDIRSLYRHEHIAPEQLIKGLYRVVSGQQRVASGQGSVASKEKTSHQPPATSHSSSHQPLATQQDLFSPNELFGNALGHEELDKVSDYYTHSDGWSNRLILGDSQLVMSSLLEREGMAGQVQCIYIDPPYGIKYGSNWQIKLNNRTVTDGQDDALSGEPEQIKAFRDTWELGIHSYLSYLRARLLVAKELLHDSGSCFVQISDENVHLVRCLMDEVFGSGNFISQINFRTAMTKPTKGLNNVFDYLLWYSKNKAEHKYRDLFLPKESTEGVAHHQLQASVQQDIYPFEFNGTHYNPRNGWRVPLEGMLRLKTAGRLYQAGKTNTKAGTLKYIRYESDFEFNQLDNTWDQQSSEQNKAYVVQTAEKIIQRCILMTTDPGDLVLDPTFGSGTTPYVAEQWGRRWIGIDTSRIALNIAKTRLMTATFPFYTLYDSEEGALAVALKKGKGGVTAPKPKGELNGHNVRYGFVYKKVPHITLGSIANNEPPAEETLYDQPLEDKKRLRVAGPFTVETLQSYDPVSPEELARQREDAGELAGFESMIFEHLKSSGVRTGDKREQAIFTRIDRLSSTALHAEGWYGGKVASGQCSVASKEKTSHQPLATSHSPSHQPLATSHSPDHSPSSERKAYFYIGPKFGTVSKQAVTEAIKACRDKRDGDWLLILGFAFEGGITELSRSFGNFQVSIVRMHDDLLQEGLLKRDKKAASFVTIGEPDIVVVSGQWLVDSGGRSVAPYEWVAKLSGLGSLAAINRAGADGVCRLLETAESGDVRHDVATAPGRRVRGGQHRRGSGQGDDGRVSAVSGDSQGLAGGTGDAADRGGGPALHAGRDATSSSGDSGDRPNAEWPAPSALSEKLATSHWPLTTRTLAVASVRGLDIYDPIQDVVKSRDVHDIAYWMLDDDYDGSNFVVKQVFFCGGDKDEFAQWQKELQGMAAASAKKKAEQTLKLEIDDEAFAALYGHTSRPFAIKKDQKVAVRVISQYGEETTKILGVDS